MRCDAWPAERKCVSRGWCGMRPVNATRCIAWVAKRLSGLLSFLLPAAARARRTIKLIRNLLLPAPGRGPSRRSASASAPWTPRQPAQRRIRTGIANLPNYGTSRFRASNFVSFRSGRHRRFMGQSGTAASIRARADRPEENARPPARPCGAACGPSPSRGCSNARAEQASLERPGHGQPASQNERIFTSACSGMPQSLVKRDCWCGREDSNLHGLPR